MHGSLYPSSGSVRVRLIPTIELVLEAELRQYRKSTKSEVSTPGFVTNPLSLSFLICKVRIAVPSPSVIRVDAT